MLTDPAVSQDEYGEVYNSANTYARLAVMLASENTCVIGWTDRRGSHYDILLSRQPQQVGPLQGGQRGGTDLFVAISRCGCFGFDLVTEESHPNYVAEKLGLGSGVTSEALAELSNGRQQLHR